MARIAVDATAAAHGGGRTYLQNLLARIPEGIEAFVLETPGHPPLEGNFESVAVPAACRNPWIRRGWAQFGLKGLLAKLDASLFFSPTAIVPRNILRSFPTVSVSQNMLPFTDEERKRYGGMNRLRLEAVRASQRWALSESAGLIFLSRFAKEAIEAILEKKVERTAVIPHGLDPAFVEPRGARPEGAPENYVLYVSALDIYKEQLAVIEAWRTLKQQESFPEKLVLLGGEWAPHGDVVRERIGELGLEHEILAPGPVPHASLPAWYGNATLQLFASSCENCPNILFEKMASGKAVLCSDRGPMPEFAGDAVAYFDSKSSEDLVEKLSALLKDPKERERLGRSGVSAIRGLDWEKTASETWGFLGTF